EHRARRQIEHTEGSRRSHVSGIEEEPVGAVGEVEEAGNGEGPLRRQQDLVRHGERGVVGELDDIGTRTPATTREIGGGYRGSAAVGGEVEAGVEAGADLSQPPAA